MKLKQSDIEHDCLVCGAKTHTFKWSIMGQIKMGLCKEHADYEPYFSFGPQMFENAKMGVTRQSIKVIK